MSVLVCMDCGGIPFDPEASPRCGECTARHYRGMSSIRSPAGREVQRAIADGRLPDLRTQHVDCQDCGRRATVYDHRDYDRPLDVDPVCRSCNCRRGHAKQIAEYKAQHQITRPRKYLTVRRIRRLRQAAA